MADNAPVSVLLTGGAGYIGSHTFVALSEAGFLPVILDNFSNSHPEVLNRLSRLTGLDAAALCERGNVLDTAFVADVIRRHGCQAVVQLAGVKAVGESVANPLKYYQTNVGGLVSVLQAMAATDCRTLVFSSSATVYGEPASVPMDEGFPCNPESPYAHSKWVCEEILAALPASDRVRLADAAQAQEKSPTPEPGWRYGVLRYFNPVGAHTSALIGEDPSGIPNNLMPFITQVAVGQRSQLTIFGNDYPTPDGTGVRDYLHVCDLAEGHVAAVQTLLAARSGSNQAAFTVNLGTGEGTSVLGVVAAFEAASGQSIAHTFAPRRAGDVAAYYADVALAERLLGWRTRRSLDAMCRDAWAWQQANPRGYAG